MTVASVQKHLTAITTAQTDFTEATKIGELYKAFAMEAFTSFPSSLLPK